MYIIMYHSLNVIVLSGLFIDNMFVMISRYISNGFTNVTFVFSIMLFTFVNRNLHLLSHFIISLIMKSDSKPS